jgi:SNF2 family DNA or RNA helicase
VALRVRRESSREAKHRAFPYQVEAVEAIKDLEFAAILHEQGLGKTKIAIDLALTWLERGEVDSVFLVTKKSLVENWEREVTIHSHLRPRIIGQDRSSNFYALNSPARVYLLHYEACVSEARRLALFLKTRRVGIICDEAQKFKNPESNIARALFELGPQFTRRVVMTGTPVANRPYDIWAPIFFLDQGVALGTNFGTFRHEYDLTADIARNERAREVFESRLAALYDRLRPFSVRETKATAGLALPGKHIIPVMVDAEEIQEELYTTYRDELRSIVVRDGVPVSDDAEDILKRLLRLVQVASDPALVDDAYQRTPGKRAALDMVLADALEEPETKAIVWTCFTDNVDRLAKHLRRFGALRVHGKMSINDRNQSLSRFRDDATARVLIATPGAAKEGLTLTVANHAIFYDRSFSLDDYLQAQDRIHRISQTRPCYIYNLMMRGTVDEWVDELLGAKHLAARLGQGDINIDEYRTHATYSFANILSKILGTDESDPSDMTAHV